MAPRLMAAMVLLLGMVSSAQAELVAFADGRVLKADDAYLEGSTIVIELRGGGTLRVPATRVDRVIADEIDDDSTPIPDFADCPWGWDGESLPNGIPYREEITAAAQAADIQPWLLVAVVRAESNFDPMAISRAGAAGLAQLMPATASDRGVADVFDPEQNLHAGAAHLRALLERFESLTLALAAYNAGPATVDRYDGVPPYRETRNYVRKVTKWFCGEPSGSS
jgi:soluble lytic murein transglycosylase-like protein